MNKLFIVFLTLALLTTPAIADEDEKEEYETEFGEREIEITQSGDHNIEIESEMEKETDEVEIQRSFEFEIDSNNFLKIELESESERETETTEEENSSEMEVEFDSIVEYEDSNGNNAYDEGEEVNVKELNSFQPLDYSTFENSENQTVHHIVSTSTDGVFQVDFYASGDFASVGSEQVTPTSVKYDITIDGYNYTQNDTRLAVVKEVESETETERETETEDFEEEISSSSGDGLKTFFSWKKTAQVDGETTDVVSSTVGDELALSYDRGNTIVHDPKVGFSPTDTKNPVQKVTSVPQTILGWFSSLLNWIPFF